MSFPVSIGDIIKALEICHWIHTNCFDPIKNASELYSAFRDDVLQLEALITQLQASFESAFEQLRRIDLDRLELLKSDSVKLIGNYLTTLGECKQLLKAHAKFNGERATALENGFWFAGAQPKVEKLRKELQLHSDKIYLFLEPVRLNLVTDISADTQEILTLLRQHSGLSVVTQLPKIPPSVDIILADALSRDCPIPIGGARNVPLREGIDAMLLHYRDCTTESKCSGTVPTKQQNLSLLKAHWLFQTIESSDSFSQSRQGSLYRRVLEQARQRIERQYKSLQIDSWNAEDFEDLDSAAWAVWPVRDPPKAEVLTDKNDREEKLAEVSLVCPHPDQKEDLYIFRVSESTLRLVSSRHLLNDRSIGPQMTERFLDLDCDGLVPFYALARPNGDCYSLGITNSKGGSTVSYEFPSRRTALRIQTAFTGYHAISLATGINCTVTWRRASRIRRSDLAKGIGEAQIWQWPVSKSRSGQSPTESSSSRRSNSIYSRSRQSSSAQQTFQMFDPSIVSITDARGVSKVKLNENPRNSQGYQTILERSSGKSLPLRRLVVNESQLDFWNIRAIAVPTSSTSKDKSRPTVENLDGTSVVLEFASEQEKTNFDGHFKHAASQRMNQVEQYNLSRHVALSQSDMPARRPSYVPTINGEPISTSVPVPTLEKRGKGAPILNPIPSFPSLDMR
ncbi:MAG: hypothetical protein Q9165_002950 [Trypethelium subeluteriae]